MVEDNLKSCPNINFANISSPNNFRELLISTNMFKMMENCLLRELLLLLVLCSCHYVLGDGTTSLQAVANYRLFSS